MMKLERMNLLAVLSWGIVVSSMAAAEYDTAKNISAIGSNAGRSVVDGARSGLRPDSLQDAFAKMEQELIEQGAREEFDKEIQDTKAKTQNWINRGKTISKIDGLLDQKSAKDAEKAKKGLEEQKSLFSKTASLAGAGLDMSSFNPPADATKSCTEKVNFAGMTQEAQSFASGPVKRLNDAVQKVLTAEGKKAEKAAEKEALLAIANVEKDLAAQEDPEIEALLKNPLPEDASDLEREKRLKKLEALNKKKKNEFTRSVVELAKKHMPKLAKAKANKALMAEVTADYAKDWEAVRVRFAQTATNSAVAARENCVKVSEQAGVQPEETDENANQFAALSAGGQFGQMFPPNSSAQRAMDMLNANYRGKLNFVPVTTMYSQLFSNMLNEVQCTDVSSQVQNLVGQPLQTQIAEVTKATDAKSLDKAVQNINNSMTTAINEVGRLFNNPDQGALAACEQAAEVKQQLDQFAQSQAQQVSSQQQGPAGGRGGFNPANPLAGHSL
jgi:hypothetical protein